MKTHFVWPPMFKRILKKYIYKNVEREKLSWDQAANKNYEYHRSLKVRTVSPKVVLLGELASKTCKNFQPGIRGVRSFWGRPHRRTSTSRSQGVRKAVERKLISIYLGIDSMILYIAIYYSMYSNNIKNIYINNCFGQRPVGKLWETWGHGAPHDFRCEKVVTVVRNGPQTNC